MCCLVSMYLIFPDWSMHHSSRDEWLQHRIHMKVLGFLLYGANNKPSFWWQYREILPNVSESLILNTCASKIHRRKSLKLNMHFPYVRIHLILIVTYALNADSERVHGKSQHGFKSFATSTLWKQPLIKNMPQLLNLTSLLMGSVMCSLMVLIHTLCEHLSSQRGTLKCSAHCSGWNPPAPLGNTRPNWIWHEQMEM